MINRTAMSLPPNATKSMSAFGLHIGQTVQAALGDEYGNIYVKADSVQVGGKQHYGQLYVRIITGEDGNGNTAYAQAQPALNKAQIPTMYGMRVLVALNPVSGGLQIVSLDYDAAVNAGINTNAYNLLDSSNRQLFFRSLRNFRLFSPATANEDKTIITIEPLVFLYEGVLYNGGKAVSDDIDLASSVPTAGNERLVLIAVRAHDRTVQTIESATRTISTAKYALSDLNVLAAQLDDTAMVSGAVRLADARATITESDLQYDVRQLVNVPRPRGWPYVISRHIHMLANQQETVRGSQTIEAGGILELDAGSDFLINPETDLVPALNAAYERVTATYSILIDDGTIGADASGGSFTVTLPSAIGLAGREYRVKKLSSGGTVTVATSSSQTIDGSSTAPLTTQWTAVGFISTGSNWIIG